jgi:heat-inducible transcriptional repressor
MRVLAPSTSENRKRRLLQAVIYHYVRTGKPVGSQVIVDKYNFGLSSATIRNLLIDLEKEGFLIQPHTSAGRIPTDKGYRFYVDSLMEIQTMASEEENRIKKEYDARTKELQDVMVSTSHMLASMSNLTGLVLSPRLDKSLLRRLQLIHLGNNQILVVVVSQTGLIRHRVIALNRLISPERLSYISDVLNKRLVGLPLSEVRTQIIDHIESVEQETAETMQLARELAREAFDLRGMEDEIYIEGRDKLFTSPEMQDYQQLSGLLKIIEEKNLLTEVLERAMKRDGLSVKIGAENLHPELHSVSLVSSTYKMGDNTVGVLGIMGPRRMEYGRMISLVEGVARIVNQMLERMNEHE